MTATLCEHPDTRFVEQLAIQARAGNHSAVIRQLLARRPQTTERPQGDPRDLFLPELGLNERMVGILESALHLWGEDEDGVPRIPTAGLLCRWSADELSEVQNAGPALLRAVRERLGVVGLSLRGEPECAACYY